MGQNSFTPDDGTLFVFGALVATAGVVESSRMGGKDARQSCFLKLNK